MNKKSLAFTLMELLVVISMIGILTAVSVVGISSYRAKGRDAQRVAGINSIAVALQNYYADNHEYPTTAQTLSVLTPKYLNTVPTDPGSGSYVYAGSANTYTITATLEIPTGKTYQYKDGSLVTP